MDLQVALDRLPLERATEITRTVAERADWVEVGTSMIKEYGMRAVTEVVAAAAPTPVLADLKTVDDAEFELTMAFDAGARSATVLGLAPTPTLIAAVRVAAERECELMVDLLGLAGTELTEVVDRLPASVIFAAHVGKDSQRSGATPRELLGPWVGGRRVAIAGGLTSADLAALRDVPNLRAVIGSAVTRSNDQLAAIRELRRAAGRD